MTSWTNEELSSIGNAEELAVASRRPDGSLRPFVTIWVVHTGATCTSEPSRASRHLVPARAGGRRGADPRSGYRARRRLRGSGLRGPCPCDRGLPREVRPLRRAQRRHRGIGGVCHDHHATRPKLGELDRRLAALICGNSAHGRVDGDTADIAADKATSPRSC
jgi:hypothetical protein